VSGEGHETDSPVDLARIGKHGLAGLLLGVMLPGGARDHRERRSQAAGSATPTTGSRLARPGSARRWPHLGVPVLFIAAEDDQPFVGAARAMYRRARVADKRLLIVRGGHGPAGQDRLPRGAKLSTWSVSLPLPFPNSTRVPSPPTLR
jgi:pimeloyl-ACP methyl ester carboxylesterase